MLKIVNWIAIFIFVAGIHTLESPLVINNAHDALAALKNYSTIEHKYKYEIPSIESVQKHTFFHEYFNDYKLKDQYTDGGTKSPDQDGVLVDTDDGTQIFIGLDEVRDYGFTNFKLPYGKLRQIDEDRFDDVLINSTLTEEQLYALNTLQLLASEYDVDAMRILADIYTFGFYDIKVNLEKAKNLYLDIPKHEPDVKTEAHSHFMLGVFYSTGLLGKTEKDAAKGLIHYNFAAKLGSVQAQMALAHKYLFGIDVSKNMDTAIYYFSLVNQKFEEYLFSSKVEIMSTNPGTDDIIFPFTFDKFDIRWSDTEEGLYGKYASQSRDSLRYFEKFSDYDQIKNVDLDDEMKDSSIDNDDIVDTSSLLYFETQKNFIGDYLHARDFDSAFKFANLCVKKGIEDPDISEIYENLKNTLEQGNKDTDEEENGGFSVNINFGSSAHRFFTGNCAQYLGHMYLQGKGTSVDYQKAKFYILLGRELSNKLLFPSDYSIMQYYGLGMPQEKTLAKTTFGMLSHYPSANYYNVTDALANFDENTDDTNIQAVPSYIVTLLDKLSHYYPLAQRKLLQLYEQGRITNISQETVSKNFNSLLKLVSTLYFDFKIPFFAFINAKADDNTQTNDMWISLVGTVIGTELGYEISKSSLGGILYPTMGDYKYRNVRNSPELYPEVYTPLRYQEAIHYMDSSALHGNVDSMIFLGDLYYNGLYANGFENDDPLWRNPWWTYILPLSAAENGGLEDGVVVKFFNEASVFMNKIILPIKICLNSIMKPRERENDVPIIPRNLEKAFSYYMTAAIKGSHMANFNVGWSYEYGIGVAQDLHLAKRYYDRAIHYSNNGYLFSKFGSVRVQMKAFIWDTLGYKHGEAENQNMEKKSWKQRLSLITGWMKNSN